MSKTPVFLLVGHGSVSAKKTIIDVGNYNVILPVKIGDKLCLTAHNMIVYNLTSTNNPDECQAPVILVHPSVNQNGPLTLIIFHFFVILHFKFWCKIFTIRFSF